MGCAKGGEEMPLRPFHLLGSFYEAGGGDRVCKGK